MTDRTQYLALVRHGQSLANLLVEAGSDRLHYELAGSDAGVELTADGLIQSTDAGIKLSRFFADKAPIARAYMSPFTRIRQTADQIDQALGYAPPRTEDRRLCKRSYGKFWNLTYKGVETLYPAEFASYKQLGALAYRPPGGENYPDVFARVDSFIADVIDRSSDNLLVVTHSVVMLTFQRCFEGLADDEVVRRYECVDLPNGEVLVYSRSDSSQPWVRCDLP